MAVAAGAGVVACASEGVVGSFAGGRAADAIDAGPTVAAAAPATVEPLPIGISTTGDSTCVKTRLGDVRCWGANRTGALGVGDVDLPGSAEPVTPSKLGRVESLAAGETSHCAIRAGSKVHCWGDMFFGSFNGRVSSHMPVMNPLEVGVITGSIARIAVGRYFLCTLARDGEVRCWGNNERGQLGLGSTELTHLPTRVEGLDGPATSLGASMGGLFACATTTPGSVYCWGDATDGQIGAERGAVLGPRRIEGLPEPAIDVVAGAAHACARLASGKVACWGAGRDGQLGDGANESSDTPREVAILTDVKGLAAGGAHTCAWRSEGAVFCWGKNDDGQTGLPASYGKPGLAVDASFGARGVACGLRHTCAWAAGKVTCFGSNSSSQLGPTPVTL